MSITQDAVSSLTHTVSNVDSVAIRRCGWPRLPACLAPSQSPLVESVTPAEYERGIQIRNRSSKDQVFGHWVAGASWRDHWRP